MKWTLPGTTLQVTAEQIPHIPQLLESMFLGGGLQLGQVCTVTGLECHTVHNWIKRGFLSGPVNKHYRLDQLCRIITINMLRPALSLEQICRLLQFVNGDLQSTRDDLIDDAALYFLFVRLALIHRQPGTEQSRDQALHTVLADYREPVPGARDRVERVLKIMLTAWGASQLRQIAAEMTEELL